MLTFAIKKLSTGANGQKEDAASFFCPRSLDQAVMKGYTDVLCLSEFSKLLPSPVGKFPSLGGREGRLEETRLGEIGLEGERERVPITKMEFPLVRDPWCHSCS